MLYITTMISFSYLYFRYIVSLNYQNMIAKSLSVEVFGFGDNQGHLAFR